jgi:K+/H+ antiporter YhaU regulatory subunit KhtT
LDNESSALGQAIAGLALREDTGASIVGIERDGERISNPVGREVILEGDVLLLLGEKDQLEQARKKLNQKRPLA